MCRSQAIAFYADFFSLAGTRRTRSTATGTLPPGWIGPGPMPRLFSAAPRCPLVETKTPKARNRRKSCLASFSVRVARLRVRHHDNICRQDYAAQISLRIGYEHSCRLCGRKHALRRRSVSLTTT